MFSDDCSPVRLHHVLDGRPRLEGGTLWGPDAEGGSLTIMTMLIIFFVVFVFQHPLLQVEELEKSLSRCTQGSQQKQQQLDSLNQGLEKLKRKVGRV